MEREGRQQLNHPSFPLRHPLGQPKWNTPIGKHT